MKRNHHSQKERRKIVAMVGDGINDAPVRSHIIFKSFALISIILGFDGC